MASDFETIPVKGPTKKSIERQKRGGESYDQLLQHMVEQYRPEDVDRDEDD